MKIFVYGTLLSNLHNNYLLKEATFIHNTTIRAKMFNIGAFPAITLSLSNKDIIHGELYEINKDILKRLDFLENYKPNRQNNLYLRKYTTTSSKIKSFVYVAGHQITLSNYQPIPSGNWKEYLTIRKNAFTELSQNLYSNSIKILTKEL
jgi:gamma-glutamylcyclotransferase (GGCT)/AIG2-like uncharacterized protein YtfP